jgi:hypothetical protein
LIIAIIGLVGTLIAAALGSPLLVELIKNKQATETPPGIVTEAPADNTESPDINTPPPSFTEQTLIFSENFDNEKTSGFAYDGGQWQVGKDKSNKVLEGDSTSVSLGAVARAIFGPSDFSNGIIEFRIRINQFGNEETANLSFRYTNQSEYSLAVMQNLAILGYRDSQNDWHLEPFSDETLRPFTFEEGVWYLVRIEARESQFSVFIDNNRLFNASDERLQKGGLEFALNPGYLVMFDDVQVWELK